MPTEYKNFKILGTAGLTIYETLCSTTSLSTAVISTISICNRTTTNKQYRLAIVDSEGTPATSEFIAFDATVAPNDTSFITVGLVLKNLQFVRVSSTDSNVTFSAHFAEIT